jgi:hypothetical protein
MHHLLGRSLDDLPPQTRRLLGLISSWVADQQQDDALHAVKFSRRDVQRFTGWSYRQIQVHLERLVEHDYIGQHGAGRGGRLLYELLDDGSADEAALRCPGLVDVVQLAEKVGQSLPMTKVLPPEQGSLTPGLPGVYHPPMSNLNPYENNGLEQKDESLTSNAGEGGTPQPAVIMSYAETAHAVTA